MSSVSNTQRVRALIEAARDANRWSYEEIARRSKTLAKSTVHAIATEEHRANILPVDDLRALALGLGLPDQVVIDAALEDAGLLVIRDEEQPVEARIITEAMRDMSPRQRRALLGTVTDLTRAFGDETAETKTARTLRAVDTGATLKAIDADPYLLPEAKAHFRNQYELLLRLGQPEPERLPYAAHGRPLEPVSPEREVGLEKIARKAAKRNKNAPGNSK